MNNTKQLFLMIFIICFYFEIYAKADFFDNRFLVHYDQVCKALKEEENFTEVHFHATDGTELNALYKQVKDASSAVIFCAGFYPGRKEGLATFAKMVPENVNILFFDARGHGKSGGRFFSNVHNYGKDEYKDILGAIEFAQQKSNAPVYVHGVCAGAYHAAQALAAIDCQKKNIKGFIFDSGLTTTLDVKDVPEKHLNEKVIPNLCRSLYKKDTKEQVQQRWLCKAGRFINSCLWKGLVFTLQSRHEQREKTMNLLTRVKNITCPILFIHSHDDNYSPIKGVQNLADQATTKECWWIDKKSEHATHHLKHTQKYKETLNNFLQKS